MRRIIIVEEDEDGRIRPYTKPIRINPSADGYTCQYCGKRVDSLEAHLCNQHYY